MRGGSASVYRGFDLKHDNKVVAVKLFHRPDAEDDFPLEFFNRESEALSKLNNHTNIVKLLDRGFDDGTNKHYLVLEWVDFTLPAFIAKIPANQAYDWRDIAKEILLPVLRGLAYAHDKQVRHRDIKPSNILVTSTGIPKLADFAISKIADSFRVDGLTVNIFGSKDYAPPEDPSCQTYNADLYCLAKTVITCILRRKLGDNKESLRDIKDPIAYLDLPTEASAFFCRMLAKDPQTRPATASVALAELERLLESLSHAARQTVYLQISSRKMRDLAQLLNVTSEDDIYRAITEDLSDGLALRRWIPERAETSDESYVIVGKQISYHVKVNNDTEAHFDLLNFNTQFTYSQLERDRENSLLVRVDLKFGRPIRINQAKIDLDAIMRGLAEFAQSRLLHEADLEMKKLYGQWENILHALTDLNEARLEPLAYSSVDLQSGRPVFEMVTSPGDALIGQIRRIAMKSIVAGTVLDVAGPFVTLDVFRGDPQRIPATGSLIIDQAATETAILRQRRALQTARNGTGARPDLGDLLLYPDESRTPDTSIEVTPYTSDFDAAKLEALKLALGAPDFAVVQGPPGTGKTTWIAELICQFLRMNPTQNILLSAQTHTALDHALAKIEELRPELQLLRIGAEEKIAQTTAKYHVTKRLAEWSAEVRTASDKFLAEWAESNGVLPEYIQVTKDTNRLIDILNTIDMVSNSPITSADDDDAQPDETERPPSGSEGVVIAQASVFIGASQKVLSLFTTEATDLDSKVAESVLEHGMTDNTAGQATTNGPTRLTAQGFDALAESTLSAAIEVETAIKALAVSDEHFGDLIDRFVEHGLSLASKADAIGRAMADTDNDRKHGANRSRIKSLQDSAMMLRRELALSTGQDWYMFEEQGKIRANLLNYYPKELSETLAKYDALEELQRTWLRTFGAGAGFESALITMSNVVAGTCVGIANVDRFSEVEFDMVIIDEASKATPTEALIALTRGRKWVLVGDNKQLPPFVDTALVKGEQLAAYDLSRHDLEYTLFDRLINLLPPACTASLTVQRRMVPEIGNLISTCFYDNKLQNYRSSGIGQCLSRLLATPVVWKSTSSLDRKSETPHILRDGTPLGFSNITEATAIELWLKSLERTARLTNEHLKIGVISGYKQQTLYLSKQLSQSDKDLWKAISIEVNTVDAFQGREVDVLVYSTTRSNKDGDIGFLASEPRLNVALSRGKDALVIFGDAEHFRFGSEIRSPFRKVLSYIESHDSDCTLEVLA